MLVASPRQGDEGSQKPRSHKTMTTERLHSKCTNQDARNNTWWSTKQNIDPPKYRQSSRKIQSDQLLGKWKCCQYQFNCSWLENNRKREKDKFYWLVIKELSQTINLQPPVRKQCLCQRTLITNATQVTNCVNDWYLQSQTTKWCLKDPIWAATTSDTIDDVHKVYLVM